MRLLPLLAVVCLLIAPPALADGHRWGLALRAGEDGEVVVVVGGGHHITCDTVVRIEVGGDNHCLDGGDVA